MEFHDKVLLRWQEYRTKKLEKAAAALIHFGLTANAVTLLSLLAGLLAVFFLFDEYFLFLGAVLLHLLLDSLDGVLARVSQPHRSSLGTVLDHGGDSLLAILAIAKTGWFLGDYYPYIIAALFALAVFMHLRFGAPVIFMRTATFILLLLFTLPVAPIVSYQKILLTAGYMIAGVVTLYSLAGQIQWTVKKRYARE